MSGFHRNASVPSLPPPQPKSPPRYPDLYGKRRDLARLHMLDREIAFLHEELKAVDRIPPASRSCKEVADFVTANVDPLIPTINKTRRSCRFWKWLCGVWCFNVSWMWCTWPRCSTCSWCSEPCGSCRMPKCECWRSECCSKWKCTCVKEWCCCCPDCSCLSCPTCSCPTCSCNPKCSNLNICSSHKTCCFPCCCCI